MKKKILICLGILSIFALTACSSGKYDKCENPIATISIEGYGDVKIELYPKEAPNTVANFVNIIEDGFLNDNAITRVQKDFVIQFGGIKDLDYTIEGEFNENGIRNNIAHDKGVISMARTSEPNSASGQFFIVTGDYAHASLDGKYAGFGKVIEGIDVIEKINSDDHDCLETSFCFLKENIKITSASVDSKECKYKVDKY